MTITRRASLAGLAGGLTLTAPSLSFGQQRPAIAGSDLNDVRAFGAKGNRRDLDDEAFRGAIDKASENDQYPASVSVSAGHYRRAEPITLPNHITFRGEGQSSVINSQNDGAFVAPILVNKTPEGAVSWRISDLSLFGGSHGVKLAVSSEIADLRFDDVSMLMQSVANIEANKLFQTSKFFGGVLGSAPYGLKVNNPTTNAFNSFGLEWVDHSEGSLYLRGATGVLVVGGRFEGGGRAGKATIDVEDGAVITFLGVFFENVHEYLARLRRVKAVSFVSCHFTGTNAGSDVLAPFKWDIDTNLVVFRDCHSSVPMPVSGNIVLDGNNVNIFAAHAAHELHGSHGKIVAAPRKLAQNGEISLLAISPAPGVGKVDGRYHCELTLTVAGSDVAAPVESFQGAFEIIEQEGVSKIALPSQLATTIGRTSIAVEPGSSDRLTARYSHRADERASASQLSWIVNWRRVAGGPTGSLLLYVP